MKLLPYGTSRKNSQIPWGYKHFSVRYKLSLHMYLCWQSVYYSHWRACGKFLFQKNSVRFPHINPQNRLLLWKIFKRNTTIFSSRMRLFEYLLQRGLSVRILPEVKLCTTIIDKDIVWYGAINTLGYATEEDNVIKVVDNKLSNELLDVLLTS